jgi:hypothetical protein
VVAEAAVSFFVDAELDAAKPGIETRVTKRAVTAKIKNRSRDIMVSLVP